MPARSAARRPASPPYMLDYDELIATNEGPLPAPLPPHLESLMERSQRLSTRVTRLADLVRRDATSD